MEDSEPDSKRRKLSHDHGVAENGMSNSISVPVAGNIQTSDTTRSSHDAGNIDGSHETQSAPITTTDAPQPSQALSKSQLKKLRKRQEWEESRESRKAKRKEKTQERKVRRRERRQHENEERKAQGLEPLPEETARQSKKHSVRLPVTFLIDCGFDDKMKDGERISLGAQVTRSYSDNSKAPYQAHLYMSSWGGHLKERFDTVLRKHHENWKGVKFTSEDFVAASKMAGDDMRGNKGGRLAGVFKKYAPRRSFEKGGGADNTGGTEAIQHTTDGATDAMVHAEADPTDELAQNGLSNDQNGHVGQVEENRQEQDTAPSIEDLKSQGEIVYLSSDSPHTLTELKPYSTYIIGGLVDKNRCKGICYKSATSRNIKTAKLPIGEYMEMQSRYVLATNHVVEIMVRWLECGDWGESFMKVIPKRKGGKLRDVKEDDNEDDENDDKSRSGDGSDSDSDGDDDIDKSKELDRDKNDRDKNDLDDGNIDIVVDADDTDTTIAAADTEISAVTNE